MNTVLNRIESEEIIIYSENTYSISTLRKCREVFESLVSEGKMKGKFDDTEWVGYSDIRKYSISFVVNEALYYQHIGRELNITLDTMCLMLKCYAVSCFGIYIYRTIAYEKINTIIDFITKYRNKDFALFQEEIMTIEDFLRFINTPQKQTYSIIRLIKKKKKKQANQRRLKPVINYLAIENEISDIYSSELDEETFKKWFPIFFWTKITFVLPLRATEMLVTPYECITREKEKVYINVRRTELKKGKRKVYYDVDKDYRIYTYEIPDNDVVRVIERYIQITSNQDRRFLFEYSKFMINDMLSLQAFNELVSEFVCENLKGNRKYDYVRYALGIGEFEAVTAGDSRPIAMANLYFQNVGADICRQLAGHVNIDTSSNYYTNISEIIYNSSIMQYQKRINTSQIRDTDKHMKASTIVVDSEKPFCASLKRANNKKDFEDCIKEGCLRECLGCKYYYPTQKELDEFVEQNKIKADENAVKVIKLLNDDSKFKEKALELDEGLLQVQTYASRYRLGCDEKVKEIGEEWLKLRNSQKNSY